jgi:hypothetical protein
MPTKFDSLEKFTIKYKQTNKRIYIYIYIYIVQHCVYCWREGWASELKHEWLKALLDLQWYNAKSIRDKSINFVVHTVGCNNEGIERCFDCSRKFGCRGLAYKQIKSGIPPATDSEPA